MIKNAFMLIGFIHVVVFLLGVTDLIHYRAYIGVEDRVIVPKAEYEELKRIKEQHSDNQDYIELVKALKESKS